MKYDKDSIENTWKMRKQNNERNFKGCEQETKVTVSFSWRAILRNQAAKHHESLKCKEKIHQTALFPRFQ